MFARPLLLLATATVSLMVGGAASAAAQTPAATTYHGVFTGVQYGTCEGGTPAVPTVTGTWNISKLGSSQATVTVNIFTDGRHHVSFGVPAEQVTSGSSTVTVQFQTLAGPLTIDLAGSNLTYVIAPYDYGGLSCDTVTYTGTLGR